MQPNQLDQNVTKLKKTLQNEIEVKQQKLKQCQRVDRAKMQVLQMQIKRLKTQERTVSSSLSPRRL